MEFILPRKLIEVALPLDAINEACAYEKMPGIGPHPRGVHLWWARRPLAAARAVLFAQMVNDPAGLWHAKNPGKVPSAQQRGAFTKRRQELFDLIKQLVQWQNSSDRELFQRAEAEIERSWREVCDLNKEHPLAAEIYNPDVLPGVHDPFAGGGAIPAEGQRLGLPAFASDLNPVAVLINKASIEIPPRFAGRVSVGQRPQGQPVFNFDLNKRASAKDSGKGGSSGAQGLSEDIRSYGNWMLERATARLQSLYPAVEVTDELVKERPDLLLLRGKKQKVIAWIWARTVRSPHPTFSNIEVPLVSSFVLSNKKGKEVYVEPVVTETTYVFTVKNGKPPAGAENGTKLGSRGADFYCLLSNAPISAEYIRAEAKANRLGQRLMAVVVEGPRHRFYLPPDSISDAAAKTVQPNWKPDVEFFTQALGFRVGNYGMNKWSDLFTTRQLVSLSTLCELLPEVRAKVRADALACGMPDDTIGIEDGGCGATAYAQAISIYLAFAISRCADFSNTLTRWVPGNQKAMNLFGKQTISMTWDFPEVAILEDTVGGFGPAANYIAACVETLPGEGLGEVTQAAALSQTISKLKYVSTDPPYYDNIGYADLSDFFYVWLRKGLSEVLPRLFATLTVPKAEELVATPGRHGGKDSAETFFLDGMTDVLKNISEQAHPDGPVTIYYAFKQSDMKKDGDVSSTGWDTFLSAIVKANFSVVGTWPLRSEQEFRLRSMGSNALASSLVLVCRRRSPNARTISRREFLRELNAVLPDALDDMTRGAGADQSPVAPVDLSQAIIGPGMAVFSKYEAVLEADGSPMSVKTALQLINRFLAEDDFDADTQFCLRWFEQCGWNEGSFGQADVLARSKSTGVDGLADAGVVSSANGKVRLLKWKEYPADWNPRTDSRTPVWEALHQLVRSLKQEGENSAGCLLALLQDKAEGIRQLAYRLYTVCERLGWAEDARAYNELITSWTGVEMVAASSVTEESQMKLFGE